MLFAELIGFIITKILPIIAAHNFCLFRLEILNEKRTAAVQMVKLAEKERDSLEVHDFIHKCFCLLALLVIKELIFFTNCYVECQE